jgi:beta-glucosidase-like glycosyl hydrolase
MYSFVGGGSNAASALVIAAALLTSLGSTIRAAEPAEKPLYLDPAQPAEKRAQDLIARLTLEEKAMLLNHKGTTVERFGIKCDRWNQCLHGVCWDRPTTLFPVPIALAATWDSNLVHEVATAISDEARAIYNGWHQDPAFPGEHKGLIYRAPVINIERNPYWGRNEEAYGEDPYLTGRLGVAYVKGLQGNDPHYLKLVSTLKHYAVNNVEQGRTSLSAAVPERMLYEYWLPHFRDCIVEGQAQSVMASYNAINGVPSNINPLLLTEILKQRWGFQGFVVSDLGGVNTMVTGHMKGQMTYEEAVAKSLIAGCDFSDKEFEAHLPAAVRQGLLPEARLNDAVYVGTNNKIESEGRDRTSLSLPGRQEDLVKAVCAANPKTVVVLMNAGPLTVPWLKENVPAILEAWWTGIEGGDAIADVLFGDANPAGRLPHTVYASESQVPPQDEYDVTKGFTYMYLNGKPLFPFGHGLSYTRFKYSNLQVSPRQIPATGKVTVRVDVENTGKRAGDEVVQLYVHQVECSVKRPSKELRGFERVTLRPGQKKTVASVSAKFRHLFKKPFQVASRCTGIPLRLQVREKSLEKWIAQHRPDEQFPL